MWHVVVWALTAVCAAGWSLLCWALHQLATGPDWQAVPTETVARVVDTTAAGDSFSAGYLAARLQGAVRCTDL